MSTVMAERALGGSVNHQQLFVSLYDELRRLAQRKLRQGGAANPMSAKPRAMDRSGCTTNGSNRAVV